MGLLCRPGRLKNTPFGRFNPGGEPGKLDKSNEAPDIGALLNQVTIDRTSVALTDSEPYQTVTITNSLPGLVELKLDPTWRRSTDLRWSYLSPN